MFRNLINSEDVTYFVRSIRTGRILRILQRLLRGKRRAVQDAWDTIENPPIQFWDIPAVHQRANALVSGDAQIDYITYVARKYLTARSPLTGISLGCGEGSKELTWASVCHFTHLDAYDLAPQRIVAARETARARGINNVHFHVGDIFQIDWPEQHYSVVFSDQSLHHFSPLEPLCANIRRTLKLDGYFVLNEYIGPSRFQWTDRQLEAVNGLLAILPARYRVRWQDRGLKTRVSRPSRLSMMLSDPSEAVESDKIISTVGRHFHIIERRDYGGTLTQLLFADIAWNFQNNDPETQQLLNLCFQAEQTLMDLDQISSDFTLLICQPRDASP